MIRKAVLPVAGFGTRFLPASKAIPKEMITVVDKPVIQYVVAEAVAAGIKEIVLVTHSAKRAIEDHFDRHYELESELEKKQKTDLLQALEDIIPADVRIISVRQGQALGLGHAVLCAKEVIGDAPFAVLLPDVLVDNHGQGDGHDLARMCAAYKETGASQIMVEEVPQERVSQYGVVTLEAAAPAAGESQPMTGVVEKPAADQAPSNLAVVGRYVLPSRIFALLENTQPGAGGEIQLTDAIADLLTEEAVAAYRMAGVTYDCGSKEGYFEATLAYAVRHAQISNAAKALIKEAAAKLDS